VQRLFRRYARFGDLAARDELFERFLPLARALARRYDRGDESLDDLVQVASMGLLAAIERFDPERGREFTSFAIPTITGELKRYFRDYGWALKIPRSAKDRAVTINRAIDQLSARLGRPPAAIEIAGATDLPLGEVLEGLALLAATRPVSLDASATRTDEDPCTVGDTIGAEDPTLELVERRDLVARSMRGLTPREHRVLYLRYVEDLTQVEIGRHIGRSQMQVSRILETALARSREAADTVGESAGEPQPRSDHPV
jgi:RNA polymerase sigma-B factor